MHTVQASTQERRKCALVERMIVFVGCHFREQASSESEDQDYLRTQSDLLRWVAMFGNAVFVVVFRGRELEASC
jgi:hypothetical protein